MSHFSYLDERPGQYFEGKKQTSRRIILIRMTTIVTQKDYARIQIGFAREHTECREVSEHFQETDVTFLSRCA